jgi:Na+/proline symporter
MDALQATRRPLWWTLAPLAEAFTPEGRGARVVILLGATGIMCLGDLAMTLMYITSIGMSESNPIARAVMEHNSPAFVVVWKLATMGLGLGILFWARRTRVAEVATWVCFLVMAALCVHWLGFTGTVSAFSTEYAALAAADDPQWVSMTP